MAQSQIDRFLETAQAQLPEEGLQVVASLRGRLDGLEALHVENALRAGWSWRQVADALGVTKQAVHKKHAKRVAEKLNAGTSASERERKKLLVTGPARESIQFAREEADALGASEVAPEHLLVGLLRDDRGPVVQALSAVGVSLERARDEVARLHARRRRARSKTVPRAAGNPLPVSARARAVMEQSLREAARRRDGHLGVEHLLLALLRDPKAVPSRTLAALGTTSADVERALDEVLGRG